MCIQWTLVKDSVVITQQSNPPISQLTSRLCNECFFILLVHKSLVHTFDVAVIWFDI